VANGTNTSITSSGPAVNLTASNASAVVPASGPDATQTSPSGSGSTGGSGSKSAAMGRVDYGHVWGIPMGVALIGAVIGSILVVV